MHKPARTSLPLQQEVVIEIADRTWSIGFTGVTEALPALDRISLLRLTSETSDEDSTYALSRPLIFYTIEGSASVQPFLEFATGPKAQEMIVETGFYPAQQGDAVSSN